MFSAQHDAWATLYSCMIIFYTIFGKCVQVFVDFWTKLAFSKVTTVKLTNCSWQECIMLLLAYLKNRVPTDVIIGSRGLEIFSPPWRYISQKQKVEKIWFKDYDLFTLPQNIINHNKFSLGKWTMTLRSCFYSFGCPTFVLLSAARASNCLTKCK